CAMGALYVFRPYRPGVVRLRLGDSTARNRLPGDFPLPAPRWASLSKTRATSRRALVVPVADLPHLAPRGAPQPSRRRPFARPYRSLLSFRDSADSQSFEPLVSFSAALDFEGRRPVQLSG